MENNPDKGWPLYKEGEIIYTTAVLRYNRGQDTKSFLRKVRALGYRGVDQKPYHEVDGSDGVKERHFGPEEECFTCYKRKGKRKTKEDKAPREKQDSPPVNESSRTTGDVKSSDNGEKSQPKDTDEDSDDETVIESFNYP
jgi:hypothetical protein